MEVLVGSWSFDLLSKVFYFTHTEDHVLKSNTETTHFTDCTVFD
jgi:hypothetical protein